MQWVLDKTFAEENVSGTVLKHISLKQSNKTSRQISSPQPPAPYMRKRKRDLLEVQQGLDPSLQCGARQTAKASRLEHLATIPRRFTSRIALSDIV